MFEFVISCLFGDAPYFLKTFQRNIALDFLINAIPRGVGQVCFVNNSIAGFIFLVSLIISMPAHFTILSLLGLVISTAVSVILPALNGDIPEDVRSGFSVGANGFNGFLYGAAMATTLVSTDYEGRMISRNIAFNCILVIIGAIFSVFILLWAKKLFSQFSLPVSTVPFNFTSIMVLAALHYAISESTLSTPSKFKFVTAAPNPFSESWQCFPFNEPMIVDDSVEEPPQSQCFGVIMKAIFRGMGQLYFSDDWRVGLTMTLSAALFSPLVALFAFLGSTIGLLTASSIDIHPAELEAGLWGFNAVLTATALGAVYFRFDGKSILVAIIGSMVTVFMQAMVKMSLAKYQIPHFTLPYVLTSFVFFFVDWSSRIPLGEEGSPEATSNWSVPTLACSRHTFWESISCAKFVPDGDNSSGDAREGSNSGDNLSINVVSDHGHDDDKN